MGGKRICSSNGSLIDKSMVKEAVSMAQLGGGGTVVRGRVREVCVGVRS